MEFLVYMDVGPIGDGRNGLHAYKKGGRARS